MSDSIVKLLQRQPVTIDELVKRLKKSQKDVREILKGMRNNGVYLESKEGKWSIPKKHPPRDYGKKHPYVSRDDNTFVFGFTGDTHLCSKYERLDVLNDLYNIFALSGVDRVYHTGNWVEGEAEFNKHELKVRGLDNQLDYFIEQYPKHPGLTTYAVTGDDHEGWWAQRNGIDVGLHLENKMRNASRNDWVNLGYMESFVPLKNANTGKITQMLVIHPGGGSAYAVSYRPQKIVESFQGGEKPSVLLIGHYHKLSYNMIRGVHAIQTGCTQDQSGFMRKKTIDAHVGGGICTITQDPRTGAIIACTVQFFAYYNKGYYNGRWGYSGILNLPERGL